MSDENLPDEFPAAPDPLAVALDAIDDFDRSQLPSLPGAGQRLTAEGRDLYKRAMLRVAYAQAHETRVHTELLERQVRLLDSIESLLIDINILMTPGEEHS